MSQTDLPAIMREIGNLSTGEVRSMRPVDPTQAAKIFAQPPQRQTTPGSRLDRLKQHSLSLTQLRILRILAESKGSLSLNNIMVRCGNATVNVVNRSVGFVNPDKRESYKRSKYYRGEISLLENGYVTYRKATFDAASKNLFSITDAGRSVVDQLSDVDTGSRKLGRLKPLGENHWQKSK